MRLPVNLRMQAHNIERMVDGATTVGLETISKFITKRQDSSSSTPTQQPCQQSSGNCYTSGDTATLPIVLGTVIPLSAALIVLFILHRRNQKKLRIEDANDPHKSLDFGLDGIPNVSSKKNKAGPEMISTKPSTRKLGGLSMDMNLTSPYLLPSGLHGSRESMRSMSRSISDEHDPYRPVMAMHADNASIRSGRNDRFGEQGSIYSMSTANVTNSHENSALIANARPMSQTYPKHSEPRSPLSLAGEDMDDDGPPPQFSQQPPPRKQSLATSDKALPDPHAEDKNLPLPPEPVAKDMPPPRTSSYGPRTSSYGGSRMSYSLPLRRDSQPGNHAANRRSSIYDEDPVPEVPALPMPDLSYDIDPSMIYTNAEDAENRQAPTLHAPQPMSTQRLSVMQDDNNRLSVFGGGYNRLSVMGVRPLPPDIPEDNPEVRANRIRSFYREYFDETKPNPAGQYEEDYDPYYLDASDYMPSAKPWAGGPGRRAMTPPPRGPPRVSGQSGPHGRKMSVMSMGRPGTRGRPPMPKKHLPPPKPLTSLPTPHLLKEDVVVFNPIDFAPPSTFRQHQNGSRPDSPAGTPRPYSPAVKAFTPLASSFDTLTVMPSPHELRKSSTFTALDFALPSRFRDPAGSLSPSDAGSIRSYRSGISAVQSDAIRQGAYRVSRLPKGVVTTREDLSTQLRPKMDLVERA